MWIAALVLADGLNLQTFQIILYLQVKLSYVGKVHSKFEFDVSPLALVIVGSCVRKRDVSKPDAQPELWQICITGLKCLVTFPTDVLLFLILVSGVLQQEADVLAKLQMSNNQVRHTYLCFLG